MLMISPSGSVDFKIMISDKTKCKSYQDSYGGWISSSTPCCYSEPSPTHKRKCDSNYILEHGRQVCRFGSYRDWECNDPTKISKLVGKTFIADGKDHVVGIRYTKSLKKYDLIIDG